MLQQEIHYQIKGMSQDLAYQLFNPQYAFEMRNIRVNTTDDNSLLSLTNEQGNSLVSTLEIANEEERVVLKVLGVGTFSDYAILFVIADDGYEAYARNTGAILKLKDNEVTTLYASELLNFQENHPIKTICIYENEDVQKVYWIDGVNPPRVINVADSVKVKSISEQKIDFLPKLEFGEKVSIEKTSGGTFPAGVIQYALTYSDRYLQESNIWYVSPLYYCTHTAKGAAAGETCNMAMKLSFTGLDRRFDFIQIYVVVRTSLNAVPSVYRIANISTSTTSFTDNGSQWETYSPSLLLGKQLNTFVPNTISSKDSTLFLGNYSLKSPYLDSADAEASAFINAIKGTLGFNYYSLQNEDKEYPFNLDLGSTGVSTFRNEEWYRFGIQFQDEYGTPSNIILLKDLKPDISVAGEGLFMAKKIACSLPSSIPTSISSKFKRARLVMVDRSNLPHRTICQGVLCPTVYRVNDRVNNSPFAMSSWCMRGSNPWGNKSFPVWMTDMPLHPNTAVGGGEIENQGSYNGVLTDGSEVNDAAILINTSSADPNETKYYYHCRVQASRSWNGYPDLFNEVTLITTLMRTTNPSITNTFDCEDKWLNRSRKPFYMFVNELGHFPTNAEIKTYAQSLVLDVLKNHGATHPERILQDLFADWRTTEPEAAFVANPKLADVFFLGNYSGNTGATTTDSVYQSFANAVNLARSIGYPFFCDHNILTFHSPDVEKYQPIIDNNTSLKYRVIGYTTIDKSYTDTYMQVSAAQTNDSQSGLQPIIKNSQAGIFNCALWKDGDLFPVYVWHRSMSLGSQKDPTSTGVWYGQYTKKVISNVHYCTTSQRFTSSGNLVTFNPDDSLTGSPFPTMGTPRVFNSDSVSALTLPAQRNSGALNSNPIYYGNVDIYHSNGAYLVPIMDSPSHITGKANSTITDPCLIRYNSTPHVVMTMNFKGFTIGKYFAPSLPYPYSGERSGQGNNHGYLWVTKEHGFARDYLAQHSVYNVPEMGTLYIAELYQDLTASDIYGGTSEENLAKLTWVPVGDWVDLSAGKLLMGNGDIFIGRWDCLKTYATSKDDMQSYVDITSFVVESDTNLESRYDSFKGIHNATMVNPTNFNLYNPVYNQSNNFFAYNFFRKQDLINNFQNQICWSDVKVLGEELDTWCQINVGNNIDLQGEYGQLRSIVNFKNNLYCFQDDAVYKLNYNTRVAISPSDGVPIQLSNNYRVDPPLLLEAQCGISSYEALAATGVSLYFFDERRGRIFAMGPNDQLLDLSSQKGVNALLGKLGKLDGVFHDVNSRDVYFNFPQDSLAYNEDLQEFTSLYDYQGISTMFSIGKDTYVTKSNGLWKQRASDVYNTFFGTTRKFYVTMLANDKPLADKIFTNVEFSMESDSNKAFNKLYAWNSYQEGEISLDLKTCRPSSLKRKFRTWRADVPRDSNKVTDRLRDKWLKFTLSREYPANTTLTTKEKFRVNNINLNYFLA